MIVNLKKITLKQTQNPFIRRNKPNLPKKVLHNKILKKQRKTIERQIKGKTMKFEPKPNS